MDQRKKKRVIKQSTYFVFSDPISNFEGNQSMPTPSSTNNFCDNDYSSDDPSKTNTKRKELIGSKCYTKRKEITGDCHFVCVCQ
jgi:hypothetical protein